jgi:putative DNA primase/helicase
MHIDVSKQIYLKINDKDTPTEIKDYDQWVLWRAEPRYGRLSKVPYRVDGRRARSTDPDTWTSFETAYKAYVSPGQGQPFSGLGFVFREGGGIAGIDLDHVIDEDGAIEPWAERVVRAFDSYTEFSVSGQGLHIICRAAIPDAKGHRGSQIEIYDRGRYFTVSGHPYGEPRLLRETQPEVDRLIELVEKSRCPEGEAPAKPHPNRCFAQRHPGRHYLSNSELLEKARNARNGRKFRALFDHGDICDYQSRSEADVGLLGMLLWWCNGDIDRADELFRQSALFRDKWCRPDYRKRCFGFLQGRV